MSSNTAPSHSELRKRLSAKRNQAARHRMRKHPAEEENKQLAAENAKLKEMYNGLVEEYKKTKTELDNALATLRPKVIKEMEAKCPYI